MKVEMITPKATEYPLWVIKAGSTKLGLENGRWLIEFRGVIKKIEKPKDVIGLLPVLEVDRARVLEHVQSICNESEFPEKHLLLCAIESAESDYWALKAAEWIEQGSFLTDSVRASMEGIKDRAWASQKLKTKIGKLLKGLS